MTETVNWSQKHLPRQRTSFVGREKEILELQQLLKDPACRLITLVGQGGTGKTRLAIAVVEKSTIFSEQFFVPLQPVGDTSAVPATIADTIGLRINGEEDPIKQIGRFLNGKRVILILDNIEHLLDSAPDLSDLLAEIPNLKLLVTSREVLNLEEEWLFPVEGLPVPADASSSDLTNNSAIALFYDRARQVRPDFSLIGSETAVIKICRLVGGLPLAIELAAAWLKTMTCDAIAHEIQNNLHFLSSRHRNVPERHRSMEVVFNQSWQMLNPKEQQIYAQISVFRGGFRREAAEAIASADLEGLTGLVEKSLLVWEGNGRYQIHELLRQFAASKLAQSSIDEAEIRRQHASYYLNFLARRTNAIFGHGQLEATADISADIDNIRLAWKWAMDNQMLDALESAVETLALFFHIRSKFLEGATIFSDTLKILPQDEQSIIKILLTSEFGWMAIRLGQFDTALEAFKICHKMYQHLGIPPLPGQGTDPRLGLSTLASIRGDYDEAEKYALEALQIAKTENHLNNAETIYYHMASIASAQGKYKAAREYARIACELCEQLGDFWFLGFCLNEMGVAANALGEFQAAKQYFENSYALREQFADPQGMALAMKNLGEVALNQEMSLEAKKWFGDALAIYQKTDDRGGLAVVHNGLGRTALMVGDFQLSQNHFQEALNISEEIKFMPVLLSVLAGIGDLLVQINREQQGKQILSFVVVNPAADKETAIRIQKLKIDLSSLAPTNNLEEITAVAHQALTTDISPIISTSPAQPLADPLTERELEVLRLLAQGKTNRQIADQLTVVLGTVKAHNNRIYSKLAVTNRTQAINRARELNLIN